MYNRSRQLLVTISSHLKIINKKITTGPTYLMSIIPTSETPVLSRPSITNQQDNNNTDDDTGFWVW